MSGPPGSGKTLLARSLPTILPRMTPTEVLDVTRMYSAAGSQAQIKTARAQDDEEPRADGGRMELTERAMV